MPHSHAVVWDEDAPSKRTSSYASGRTSSARSGSSRTASGRAASAAAAGSAGGARNSSPRSRPSALTEAKGEDDEEEEEGDLFGDGSGGVTLTLGRKHDLRNVGALPVLRLSLWGREVIAKDKPLGVGLVDLASLPADGKAMVTWETLEPATGMDPDMTCGRYTRVYFGACVFGWVFWVGVSGVRFWWVFCVGGLRRWSRPPRYAQTVPAGGAFVMLLGMFWVFMGGFFGVLCDVIPIRLVTRLHL